MAPGTVHCYESVADYLPLGEPGYSPDTAGCINILTPKRFVTPTSTGMAPNSCLIQVEKWALQHHEYATATQRLTRRHRNVNPIITASLTGPAALKKDTPAMPGTPEEIAESRQGSLRGRRRRASTSTCATTTTSPPTSTWPSAPWKPCARSARASCSSPPAAAFAYEERMRIVEAKPAMATLNPATMTMGDNEFRNPPKQMCKLAERMLELGIKAEVEIYDTGHIALMLDLLKKGLLTEPLQVSFVMGIKGGMPADPMLLAYCVRELPAGHQLAGHRHLQGQPAADHHRSGHGRQRARRSRGHAVVRPKELATSNAQLVEQLVGVAKSHEPAAGHGAKRWWSG